MVKLKNYLLSNFSQIYFSIFLPLYVIASVIMLIKIAAYTAFIKLTLLEMLKMYVFMLPELLFYTLPITFFISAVMTISKLSFDYEMLVIFSLGIKPSKIIVFFTKLAILQSLLLFVLFLVVSPHTKNLAKNFMIKKKSEANFNIEASEYGHKFNDWLVFVGKDNADGSFGNVVMFNQGKKDETLIIADKADILSEANVLKLNLTTGKGFVYSKEALSELKFRTMHINDTTVSNIQTYKNPLEYWRIDTEYIKKHANRPYLLTKYIYNINLKYQKLASQTLISLFPILSVLFILSIGVINARHQKSFTYLYIFTVVILFYVGSFLITKYLVLYTIPLVSIVTLLISYFIYNKKISKRY